MRSTSSSFPGLDILCFKFGTKEHVKEVDSKLNHCLLRLVQLLGVDLALDRNDSENVLWAPEHGNVVSEAKKKQTT